MKRIRTYSDEQLTDAVRASTSWRGVLRALGLTATSSSAIRSVRGHAERLGLDRSHFKNISRWKADDVASAVTNASSWVEAGSLLGVTDTTALSSLRRYTTRVGLDTRHLAAQRGAILASAGLAQPSLARLRNAGPLLAAAWFTLCGYDVSWPLEPSRYDLLVSKNDDLRRVQVKTTTTRAGSTWKVYLSTCPHGRRMYDSNEVDDFFVIDGDLTFYRIPIAAVAGLQAIHVSGYDRYRVPTGPGEYLERAAPD